MGELIQEPAQEPIENPIPEPAQKNLLTNPQAPKAVISLGPISRNSPPSQLDQDIEFNSDEEPEEEEEEEDEATEKEVASDFDSPILEMDNIMTDTIRELANNPDANTRSVSHWTQSIQIVLNKNPELTARILSQKRTAEDASIGGEIDPKIRTKPRPGPLSRTKKKRKYEPQPEQDLTELSKEVICHECQACQPTKIFRNLIEAEKHKHLTGHADFEVILVERKSLDAVLSRTPILVISKLICDSL